MSRKLTKEEREIFEESEKKFYDNFTDYFELPLQGCLGWMLYRDALYCNFDLREIPITDQLCCLLQSKMPQDVVVECEVSYSEIFNSKYAKKRYPINHEVLKNCYADIVLKRNENIFAVIEVKRYKNKKKKNATNIGGINEDLCQLAAIRQEFTGIRTFEFVIANRGLPKEFVVAETGRAKTTKTQCKPSSKSKLHIDSCMKFKTIRSISLVTNKCSKKALNDSANLKEATKKMFSTASFACVVEVLNK